MTTPTIPEKIKIIGKQYSVEMVPELDECGLCYDTKQLIKISEDLPHDLTQDTILHEIMHAIDYQMHIGMKERQISAMAAGIMAVFKENPGLLKFITSPTSATKSKTPARSVQKRKKLTK